MAVLKSRSAEWYDLVLSMLEFFAPVLCSEIIEERADRPGSTGERLGVMKEGHTCPTELRLTVSTPERQD